MPFITKLIIVLILSWNFIHTISYAKFVWTQKNKLGAVAVIFLALLVIIVPFLTIYMRG